MGFYDKLKSFDFISWLIGKIPLPFPKTRIDIRRKMIYKDCPIYVIQFQNCWMRLFVFKGEAYQNHAFIKPLNPIRYLGFMCRLLETPYGKIELDGGDQALMQESIKAIDQLVSAGSLKKALKK